MPLKHIGQNDKIYPSRYNGGAKNLVIANICLIGQKAFIIGGQTMPGTINIASCLGAKSWVSEESLIPWFS